jgi:hypothetical protein
MSLLRYMQPWRIFIWGTHIRYDFFIDLDRFSDGLVSSTLGVVCVFYEDSETASGEISVLRKFNCSLNLLTKSLCLQFQGSLVSCITTSVNCCDLMDLLSLVATFALRPYGLICNCMESEVSCKFSLIHEHVKGMICYNQILLIVCF